MLEEQSPPTGQEFFKGLGVGILLGFIAWALAVFLILSTQGKLAKIDSPNFFSHFAFVWGGIYVVPAVLVTWRAHVNGRQSYSAGLLTSFAVVLLLSAACWHTSN
jgi:hypothetical protein